MSEIIIQPVTMLFDLLQVAEITRILRSGGIFVATTFLRSIFADSSIPAVLRPFLQVIYSFLLKPCTHLQYCVLGYSSQTTDVCLLIKVLKI